MEGHGGGQELGDRSEHGTATAPLLAVPLAAAGGGLEGGDGPEEVGGAPGEDVGLAAVAHADVHRVGEARDLGEDGFEDGAGDAAHGQHGGGLTDGPQVETTGGPGCGGADEAGDGVDVDHGLGGGGLVLGHVAGGTQGF